MAEEDAVWDMSSLAERMEEDVDADTGREHCEGCDRPRKVCLCSSFPPGGPVRTKMHILMLMHPLEVKRKIRTGHLCQKILQKCEILVNRKFKKYIGKNPHLDAALADPGSVCVLFPAADAADLGDVDGARARKEIPAEVKHLIVFDGTWGQARELFNHNKPQLEGMHKVQFCQGIGANKGGRSEFVVRKEPTSTAVCTLEAIVACVCALEPECESMRDAMLRPLRDMVKFQLDLGFPMEIVQQHLNGGGGSAVDEAVYTL